ncbi:MAG: hypothetical protein NC084_06625 [Bacteroides sp.]|nr:hypothetical protein [Eubacterium sp.]MCM1418245.1 hypothetical protein [Roseburia sp.]MCM1462373.1 hypothetical protein [Bacteroides sp.]
MKSDFNRIGISDELDTARIRHLMKVGLFAAFMVLAGDILIGYGAANSEIAGIPATFARYLFVSDARLFWAALLGMIGIPIECLCYFSIYRLIAPKSARYAHIYRAGIFGSMIFGACGVHVPCSAAVYFLKKMYAQSPETALNEALKFILYFMLPATVVFLIFFAVLNIAQIAAFAKGLTPLPRWAWIFNVLFGLLAAAIFKLPNLPLTNGLAAGWISLGNLWTFGGLLILLKKEGAKK